MKENRENWKPKSGALDYIKKLIGGEVEGRAAIFVPERIEGKQIG